MQKKKKILINQIRCIPIDMIAISDIKQLETDQYWPHNK